MGRAPAGLLAGLILTAAVCARAQDEQSPQLDPAALARGRAEAWLKACSTSKLRCLKAKRSSSHTCDNCYGGVRKGPLEKLAETFMLPKTAEMAWRWTGQRRASNNEYAKWRPGARLLPIMLEESEIKEVFVLRDRVMVYTQVLGLSMPEVQEGGTDVLTWIVRDGQAWLDPTWSEVGQPLLVEQQFEGTDSAPGFFTRLSGFELAESNAGTTVAREDAAARKQAFLESALVADKGWVGDVQQAKDQQGNPIEGRFWVIVWSGSIRVNVSCEGPREEFTHLEKWTRVLFRGKHSSHESFWKPDPRLDAAEVNWTLTLEKGQVTRAK